MPATLELELEHNTMAHRPLTEIERQQKAIAALGDGFTYPLFNGRNAIESARKSGYKNTARAAREIVDNALEAGAKNVHVVFNRVGDTGRSKNQRRDAVSAVAFIDDGPGMIPQMARYALSWGGGTHFDNPTGIGRFGFGLPNSSINQTRRVEVYTRTDPKAGWTLAVLDITEQRLKSIPPSGLVQIDEPTTVAKLPTFVESYASKSGLTLKTGTVVVWDKPDRLSAKSAGKLRDSLLDDFGVVYRYLLNKGRFEVLVDNTAVQAVDPLFLTPGSLFYKPQDQGGAICSFDRHLFVKQYRDEETGAQHLELLQGAEAVKEARKEAEADPRVSVGTMQVRIARFPYGFVSRSVSEENDEGRVADGDAKKRMQFRKRRRGISFVRANREVDTVDAFPTTASDKAGGLGRWPVLQGYALHWGIEIRFSPNLDDSLGIGNDKQTVNPVEDFWRVLAEAEVDRAARLEQKYQADVRAQEDEKAVENEVANPDATNPAVEAAAEADAIIGLPDDLTPPPPAIAELVEVPSSANPVATIAPMEALQSSTATDPAPVDPQAIPANPQAPEQGLGEGLIPVDEPSVRKYAIDFYESDSPEFMTPEYDTNLRRVAKINKKHPFYKIFYSTIVKTRNAKARQVVDLLLLALARGELGTRGTGKVFYEYQRKNEWSRFLEVGLKILDELQIEDPEEKEEEVEVD